MATLIVTTKDDVVNAGDGVLSLREALAAADATPTVADTIRFDVPAMGGNQIVLAGSQLSVGSDVTIAGGAGITIDAGEQSRVLLIQQGSTTNRNSVTLDHLTLSGGSVSGQYNGGGGIRADRNTELTLNDSVVYNNTASGSGCHGGGIYSQGSLKIVESEIHQNTTSSPFGSNYGGGISSYRGISVEIINSSISQNYANGSRTLGGGLSVQDPENNTVRIFNSNISSNVAAGAAGIDCGVPTELTIINSTVNDNTARELGAGGINANLVTLVNSTVSGNSTVGGTGGIDGQYVTLINSTIAFNRGIDHPYSEGVGGVHGDVLHTANSIVGGNSVKDGLGEPDVLNILMESNGHNIFGSDIIGNAPGDLENVSTALLFAGGLADNGGPTQTIALRDASDNPALGGADPADAPATDQRGVARPLPAGTDPDIGAFELDQTITGPTLILGTNRSETLLGTAGDDLMRAFGGNDILRAFGGNDQLFGGNGNDLLLGKGGLDRMHGGAGADKFALRLLSDAPADGPGYDEVLDFSRAQHDRIDVSRLDAKGGVTGDQAFTFIGTAEFSAAGQLRYEATADGDFLVSGSADRDLDAEFAVLVHTNLAGLKAADFLL